MGYHEMPIFVAVKDTWIDPLRKYTEGTILHILNKARIEGVPTLIYDGQVTTKTYDKHGMQTTINNSMHHIWAALKRYASSAGSYQLWVLY